jgi:hypothetical protein
MKSFMQQIVVTGMVIAGAVSGSWALDASAGAPQRGSYVLQGDSCGSSDVSATHTPALDPLHIPHGRHRSGLATD